MTKGYGFSVDDIDWSTPKDLEPYHKAYALQIKQEHRQAWLEGFYVHDAFGAILATAFSKKGAKSIEYYDEPLCDKRELTPEEMEQRNLDLFEALFNQLQTIKPTDGTRLSENG